MGDPPAHVILGVIAACQACNSETQWDVSYIDDMIQRGYDINQGLGNIGGILGFAVRSDKLPLVEFLLSHGADPNANLCDEIYSTLEFAIVSNTSLSIISLLIDRGAVVKQRSAALLAAQAGRLDILKHLISSGAGVDSIPDNENVYDNAREQDDWGTPLHGAAGNGKADCVAWLLQTGASRDIKNHNGLTPREVAEKRGHARCVTLIDQNENEGGCVVS
ncbi:Ankyrin-3 [Daldinia childiae]|uniref:Ankyrin-3 n=1 Tax=Daldinia childiae TaxID=326645 RepID=UPI00144799C4|nr:Ankyrin-3 [Daldinia childiae]KAF3057363.1 Ankyrin-3 [Daldinia childiae]